MQNMFGLVPSYLRTSILMKARCVDAEWQPKRRESRRLQKSGARMTVAEMKGDSRGRETSPCDCTMCGAIPRVCQSDDKPWDAERLLGKRKRGCRAQWGVHGKGNCVRGWQRYSPQQWDQRAYGKKKKHKCLASEWLRWREWRLSNPPGWEQRSARPNLQFWTATLGMGDRFPLTAAGSCDGGSICHLQILEETMLRGALGAIWDSELRVFAV